LAELSCIPPGTNIIITAGVITTHTRTHTHSNDDRIRFAKKQLQLRVKRPLQTRVSTKELAQIIEAARLTGGLEPHHGVTVVLARTATTTYSFGHGLHTLPAVARSTQPFTLSALRGMVK